MQENFIAPKARGPQDRLQPGAAEASMEARSLHHPLLMHLPPDLNHLAVQGLSRAEAGAHAMIYDDFSMYTRGDDDEMHFLLGDLPVHLNPEKDCSPSLPCFPFCHSLLLGKCHRDILAAEHSLHPGNQSPLNNTR